MPVPTRRTLLTGSGAAVAATLFARLPGAAQEATPAATPVASPVALPLASPVASIRDWEGENWVGSWATAPTTDWPEIEGFPDTSVALNNQTFRQIVRPSLAGKRMRVRLANTYGDALVNIGAAQVAIRDAEADTFADTSWPITFAGNTSISIPAGATVLSDPIPLDVQPLQELAVSLYFPDALTATTIHGNALQTNYLSAPGDHTMDTAFPVASTVESTAYLTGIDVLATPQSRAIVAYGDSITDGFGATSGAYGTWPDALTNRLVVSGLPRAVLNEGIGGNRLLSDSLEGFGMAFGESALRRFDRDVLGQAGVGYLITFMGINDIGLSSWDGSAVRTSAELITALDQLIERAHEHGIVAIGGTITPFEEAMYYSAEGEATRQEVNAWIRDSGAFDHVVDFDAAVQDPAQPGRILADYDSGDHLHINDAGYIAMAEAINLDWFAN
ncbi:MAG: SGNH/GDSL hydrolase family protein [Thermomicrobiales bacterium]